MDAQSIRELLNAERERRRKAIGFLRGKYKFDQARAEDHMNAGSGIRTRCPACEGRGDACWQSTLRGMRRPRRHTEGIDRCDPRGAGRSAGRTPCEGRG